jgi:hypothetical protein
MRGTVARSLIVGRQASAADVRIDHKSVSRRHTALYYKHKSSSSSSVMPVLVVRDLGGKHGTHVDDSRLEKNGTVELPLLRGNNREHTIRFGNAPLVCRAIIVPPASRKINEGESLPSQQQRKRESNTIADENEQMQQCQISSEQANNTKSTSSGSEKESENDANNMDTKDDDDDDDDDGQHVGRYPI